MENNANHIGNSLEKFISKYNLEQARPIVQTRLIYIFFLSKLSLKTGPASYNPKRLMVQKIWY
jgi:hypothetical protein